MVNLHVTVWEADGSTQMFVVPYRASDAYYCRGYLRKYSCWRAITDRQTLQRIGADRASYVDVWSAVESHCIRRHTGATHYQAALLGLGDLSGGGEFICRWKRHTQSASGEAVQQEPRRLRYSNSI